MVRIFPYSAIQFTAFEFYKQTLPAVLPIAIPMHEDSHLLKFSSGALAGVTAVGCTFPLDLIRLEVARQ